MALYTIQTPYRDNWSKNPVNFKLGTTSILTDILRLSFSLQIQDIVTGLWSEVYNGQQRFDSNGESELDISRLCDGMLEYYVAKPYDEDILATPYIVFKKQARNFKVLFWESDDVVGTLLQSASFYVVKGGVSKEQYNAEMVYNYFFNAANTLRWLTYGSTAYRDQGMLFVSLYMPYGFGISNIKVGGLNGPGGADVNVSVTADQGDVVVLFIDLSILDSDVNQLTFEALDGLPVSATLTMPVITRRYVNSKIYVYVNSLGGTEVVYMPYNQIKQSEQARDTYSRLSDALPVPYQLEIAAENFQANQLEEIMTGIDTGMLSALATEQMRELMLSPLRYEVDWDNRINTSIKYIPVIVVSKKNILHNSRNMQPLAQYFEITRAVRNSQYTPGRNDCSGRLLNTAWADVPPPVEDYFYMLIEPMDNPAVFEYSVNQKIYVNYGDNTDTIVNSATTHTYADNKVKKVTFGTLLELSYINLYITTHGKVSKIWGNLPRRMPNFKCNDQALTVSPELPNGLVNLEIEDNELELVPVLPAALNSAKLAGNAIVDLVENNIPAGLIYLDLSANALSVGVVNYLLVALDDNGLSNGVVKLESQTPAAAPTGAGATAAISLAGKGWTVTTD